MAFIILPQPMPAGSGTAIYQETSWGIYLLDFPPTKRISILKVIRKDYMRSYEKPISYFLDLMDDLPLQLPADEIDAYKNFIFKDAAEKYAEKYRAAGAFIVVVPRHIDFSDYFETLDDETKEKLIFYINYFSK
jgi:hypothetical protein